MVCGVWDHSILLPVDFNSYNDPTQPQEIHPLGCGRDRFYTIIEVGDSCSEVVERGDAAAARLEISCILPEIVSSFVKSMG